MVTIPAGRGCVRIVTKVLKIGPGHPITHWENHFGGNSGRFRVQPR